MLLSKGDPPMTGTGTLTIIVKDVNDNFPQFRDKYQPQVPENSPAPALVQEIFARDPDAEPYGPPFGFSDPPCKDGSNTCPCEGRPTCEYFDLHFDPSKCRQSLGEEGCNIFSFVYGDYTGSQFIRLMIPVGLGRVFAKL